MHVGSLGVQELLIVGLAALLAASGGAKVQRDGAAGCRETCYRLGWNWTSWMGTSSTARCRLWTVRMMVVWKRWARTSGLRRP